jgi:hypothetical protein
MRYVLIGALALSTVVAQAIPQTTARRKSPCKTPENAASCYWTHGRLALYNGNPSFRVWRIGTTKVVGIHSGPDAQRRDPEDGEHPEFPANIGKFVDQLVDGHRRIFADFEICPFAPERKGEMQFGCIESAKNIVLGEVDPSTGTLRVPH